MKKRCIEERRRTAVAINGDGRMYLAGIKIKETNVLLKISCNRGSRITYESKRCQSLSSVLCIHFYLSCVVFPSVFLVAHRRTLFDERTFSSAADRRKEFEFSNVRHSPHQSPLEFLEKFDSRMVDRRQRCRQPAARDSLGLHSDIHCQY